MMLADRESTNQAAQAAARPGPAAQTRASSASGVPADEADSPPLVFNPAELRQLRQAYQELLDLHHAEVVDDEAFEDAHRLLVEQVLPLRAILREQEHMIVDPRVELTY
jgi:hypothetical protein